MIVLDTHAWYWWTKGDDNLSAPARTAIEASSRVGVSCYSCLELAVLVEKGRLVLNVDIVDWIARALAHPRVALEPMNPAVAVRAARLGRGFPRDPADRVITATALVAGVPLVTRDESIAASGVVKTIW